jgi:archaemetzincin
MKLIQLLPIGDLDPELAKQVGGGLSAQFGARCELVANSFDPEPALHPERHQYHSTELLARLEKLRWRGPSPGQAGTHPANAWRLIALTPLDLYIPTLTFVFGEAQIDGPCAVISAFRLRQEFYGLPADPVLLGERLLKEAVHELGHTLGLRHCADYRCVMAPSHSVEWVDLKSASFCPACRARL